MESTAISDIYWPRASVSEIFILVRKFEMLLDTVNRKQNELEELTRELEQRVEKRILELKISLAETCFQAF